MPSSKPKILLSFLLALGVAFCFQNCAGQMEDSLDQPSMAFEEESLEIMRSKSHQLRVAYCASCHEGAGSAEPSQILNEEFLIANGWIVPGQPESSKLYLALHNNMPKDQPLLSPPEIDIFRKWISYLLEDGEGPGILSMQESSPHNFGTANVGQVIEYHFTLQNNGDRAAQQVTGRALEPPFRYKGSSSFPGVGGCFPIILPGASCKVVIEYAPVTTGVVSQNLKIIYHDGSEPKSLNFTLVGGQSLEATIVGADSNTSVGNIVANFKRTKTYTLKNTGVSPATSLGVSVTAAPFRTIGGTCASSLAPGATCTSIIEYAPTAAGNHAAKLRVAYHNGTSNRTSDISISGMAVAQSPNAQLIIDGEVSHSLGTVYTGSGASFTSTITNTGLQTATGLTGTSPAPFGFRGGTFPGTGGTCGSTLASTASCTVVVEYRPTTQASHSGKLTVFHSQGNVTKNLSGIGRTAMGILTMLVPSGNSVDFGAVPRGTSKYITVVLKNTGQVNITNASQPRISEPFAFTATTCTANLAVNATCTISSRFAPSQAGAYSGSITVTYNNGVSGASLSIPFRGSGQ